MYCFQTTLKNFRKEIDIWIHNYFRELRVTRTDEDRVVLAIDAADDARIVVDVISSNLIRLELRSYGELEKYKRPSQLAQRMYMNLVRKMIETWKKPKQLPYGEKERIEKRSRLPGRFQFVDETLQDLHEMTDEEKPPKYDVLLKLNEANHQNLKQELDELRLELNEIFAVDVGVNQQNENLPQQEVGASLAVEPNMRRKPGRPRDPWNQRAIERLLAGEAETTVIKEWREDYESKAGVELDKTADGAAKTWNKRVRDPYMKARGQNC